MRGDHDAEVFPAESRERVLALVVSDPPVADVAKMMFPLVADLAAEGVPVRLTCGVLGFTAQTFYKWRARPCSDRDWADAHTTNVIMTPPATQAA